MPRPDLPTDPASLSERYRAFLDRTRALTGTLSSEELFAAIHRETEEALEASGFYISLYDQGRDLATIVYYADKGEVSRVGVSYRGSDSEVIRTQRASMVNEDLNDRSLLVLGEDDTDVTSSAISAPMIHKGRMIGALRATRPRPTRKTISRCCKASRTSRPSRSTTHTSSPNCGSAGVRRSRSKKSEGR